jgi:peptidoglycan/LPS O-acetylase OafA/YrhL
MIKLSSIPERLTRVTLSGQIIKEIDGLRFIAILPVLIQHMNERFIKHSPIDFGHDFKAKETLLGFWASMGFIGVYIFFVISGFVLGLQFAKYRLVQGQPINLRLYYWRRITRLEPPYIFWITTFFVVFLITKQADFFTYLPHYVANLTYTHALIYNDWSPFNPVIWTLEIEVQFYIIAPFVALALFAIQNKLARRLGIVLAILLIISAQLYFFPTVSQINHDGNLYKLTNLNITAHLHYFLLGFLLADIYICDWKTINKNIIFDVLAIGCFLAMVYGFRWNFNFLSTTFFVLALLGFFYSSFKSVYLNAFITNRWIMAIGGMCYTIYLIHLPLAELLILWTKNISISTSYEINLLLQLSIFIPIVLLVSAIFYLLLEKPFMYRDWPKRLAAKFSSKHRRLNHLDEE